MFKQQGANHRDHHHTDRCHGEILEDRTVADESERIIERVDHVAVQDHIRKSKHSPLQTIGRDERRDLDVGDHVAVDRAEQRAHSKSAKNGNHKMNLIVFQQNRRDDAAHRHDGAGRQIRAIRDNGNRFAHAEDNEDTCVRKVVADISQA